MVRIDAIEYWLAWIRPAYILCMHLSRERTSSYLLAISEAVKSNVMYDLEQDHMHRFHNGTIIMHADD